MPTTPITRKASLDKVDALMKERFAHGTPRSDAYKRGVRSILEKRLAGIAVPPLPYASGTAEADAYWGGQDHGHDLARTHAERAAA